jgi:hypothetical protein
MRGIVLLLLFFAFSANSQVSTIEYNTHVVQQAQNIYLNSATRIGGKTRSTVTVDLPPNTVEWYYSFTTSENPPQRNVLNLASQLTSTFTGSKLIGEAVKDLFAPTGSAVCDIYLLSEDNVGKFIDKEDLGFGSYRYLPSGTRENIKNSVVKVNAPLSGRYYLGLRNPSGMVGLNIQIEIIAVVRETRVDKSKWNNEILNGFHTTLKAAMTEEGLANDVAAELSDCMVNQLKEKYTPENITSLSESERDKLLEEVEKGCKEKIQPKNEAVTRQYYMGISGGNPLNKEMLTSVLSIL